MSEKDSVFSEEQKKELKRIWEERYRELSRRRRVEEAITWIAFLSSATHWYERLMEEGKHDAWATLTTALEHVEPDLTQGEWIVKLEDYFHVPYLRPKPEKPPKEEKPKVPTAEEIEKLRKEIEKLRKEVEELAPKPPKFSPSLEKVILELTKEVRRRVEQLYERGIITEDEASEYAEETNPKRISELIDRLYKGEEDYSAVKEEFQTKIDLLKSREQEVPVTPSPELPPSPFAGAMKPIVTKGRGTIAGAMSVRATLTFPSQVIVRSREYIFSIEPERSEKAEEEMKPFRLKKKEFDPDTNKITYTYDVIALDLSTEDTLKLVIPFPPQYWESGEWLYGYFYSGVGCAQPRLDLFYDMYGEEQVPEQFKPWFKKVCTEIVPKIRSLGWSAVGQMFPVR
jgi:polyhydroxyalkanoate synthesis regulator phasin